MKKILLSTLMVTLICLGTQAQTTHTIIDDGFTFSPADLTVNVGDSVIFSGSDFHPVLEVSEATWNDNGITPLAGGFDFPAGSGKLKFTQAGAHFYVCTAHVASKGMKGKITVVVPTAISDISGSDILSVYPVPLTGSTLQVTFKNPVQRRLEVSIYDLTGKLRVSANGSTANGQFTIDCSNLTRGLFLMKLTTDAGDSYTKFVKE